jgi:DnaJ family protein A protein 5
MNKRQPQRHPQRQPAATTYVEPEWQKHSSQNIATANDEYGGNQDEWVGGQDGQEEWECVACGKTFRSEKAWGNHERSNKHLKEVARYDNCAACTFVVLSHAKSQAKATDG